LAVYDRLRTAHPTIPRYRHDHAASHNNLGMLLMENDRLPDAQAAFQKALALQEPLVKEYPDWSDFRIGLASTCINLGHLHRAARRPREPLPWYARALDELEVLDRQTRGVARSRALLQRALGGRAVALGELARHREALDDWDRMLALKPEPAWTAELA